jgi:hypothetical protein
MAIPTRRILVAERWTYVPDVPEADAHGDADSQHHDTETETAMHSTAEPPKHPSIAIPNTIDKVHSSPEWEQWSDTCKSELQSMRDLKTHTLMPLPEGCQAVGSRWVFMVKTDEEGNITRHKAHFVMQGYTQVEGVDYTEMFRLSVRNHAGGSD